MFEESGKAARHRFEWWEDIRGLLYHVDDYLGGRVCSRLPTCFIPICSALVDGAILGFQTFVLSGNGSGVIGVDTVAYEVVWRTDQRHPLR